MAEYIEREAVLNILASKNAPWDGYQKVSELPIADVQPMVHGRWEHDKVISDLSKEFEKSIVGKNEFWLCDGCLAKLKKLLKEVDK